MEPLGITLLIRLLIGGWDGSLEVNSELIENIEGSNVFCAKIDYMLTVYSTNWSDCGITTLGDF